MLRPVPANWSPPDSRVTQRAHGCAAPANRSNPSARIRASVSPALLNGNALIFAAGLPGVTAATAEAFVPQMLNLDLLGAISISKGCYVGQEIVARTQNLGRIKRRMYRFRAPADDLEAGAMIHGPDGATGKIVATAASGDAAELTAVIPIGHAEGKWYVDEARRLPLERLALPYAIP